MNKKDLRDYIEYVKERGQRHPWELSELERKLNRMEPGALDEYEVPCTNAGSWYSNWTVENNRKVQKDKHF